MGVSREHKWVAGSAALHRALCVFFVLMGLISLSGCNRPPTDFAVTFDAALFRASEDSAWQEVRLPDSWHGRGIADSGHGQYSITLTLPPDQSLDAGWALRTSRMSIAHRIHVNGHLVASHTNAGQSMGLSRPVPTYLEIPPAVLHAGENSVRIDTWCTLRCGLGAVEIGSAELVLSRHLKHEVVWSTLPQMLNISTLSLAFLMLFIWWRRPSEKVIGLFALLWIPTILRCFGYFVERPTLSVVAVGAVYFMTNIATTALFSIFTLELTRHQSMVRRRVLWLIVALTPILGLMAWMTQEIALMRTVVYPFLLLINLHTIGLLWDGYRTHKDRAMGVLLLATLGLTAAGAHDYLYVKGWFSLDDFFWFPWAIPLIFIGFAIYFLQRLFRALGEAEELNVQLEQRVADRTSDLQAANRAQTQFIAAASHDLRQPLHTIGLLMANLRERLTNAEEIKLLSSARSSLQSMDNLLHGILDISRLDSGVDKPVIEAIPLNAMWGAMAKTFSPEASRLGLTLRMRPTALWVASDRHMLQRVLNNLVANALRYTNEGTVLVTARPRGKMVLIQVWDTGIGIPEQFREKIFQEFVQLNNPQRDRSQGQGLGLGLAIVWRTLKLLDLQLGVRSQVGSGSVFSLHVPRVILPETARAVTVVSPPPDVAGLFVLLLDDERDALYAMQGLLRDWGCLVEVADSGAAAVQVLDTSLREPDAMLLDYRLRGESGLDVGRNLLSIIGHTVPVLMITGDVASQPLKDMAASGFDVLHKPVDTLQLRAWLARVKAAIAQCSPDVDESLKE